MDPVDDLDAGPLRQGDIPAHALAEALLLQLGELGAVGNYHQRCDCQLPLQPAAQPAGIRRAGAALAAPRRRHRRLPCLGGAHAHGWSSTNLRNLRSNVHYRGEKLLQVPDRIFLPSGRLRSQFLCSLSQLQELQCQCNLGGGESPGDDGGRGGVRGLYLRERRRLVPHHGTLYDPPLCRPHQHYSDEPAGRSRCIRYPGTYRLYIFV